MRNLLILLLFFLSYTSFAQTNNAVITYKLNQNFGKIIQDLSDNYIYLEDKKTDFDCVKQNYSKVISQIKTNQQRVLFFEYLLSEFYDNSLLLSTKTVSSYRLHSPFYITIKEGKFFIQNIWYSQIEDFGKNIVGAEILNFNSRDFNEIIDEFSTQCINKELPEVREWIANKIISGRLNESRILTLKLKDKKKISLDIDRIKIKKEKELLSVDIKNEVAIIRIHNSLGNINLIKHFDRELDALDDTKGLVLDLRNTIKSGNSYIIKAIMSRFTERELPYEKRMSKEKFGNNPEIVSSSLDFVSPRGTLYKKPVVVLVGKWTGSSGSSLAVGLNSLKIGKIVGSEMGEFGGATENYSFTNRDYGYTISTDKLFHINGTTLDKFIPDFNITQESIVKDDVLEKAISLFEISNTNNYVSEVATRNSIASKIDK